MAGRSIDEKPQKLIQEPPVSKISMRLIQNSILLCCPRAFVDCWIQMVVPSVHEHEKICVSIAPDKTEVNKIDKKHEKIN